MKRTIPEKHETICDRCKREIRNDDQLEAGVVFHCNGLDYQGYNVGPGDHYAFDLCSGCYSFVKSAFEEMLRPGVEQSK